MSSSAWKSRCGCIPWKPPERSVRHELKSRNCGARDCCRQMPSPLAFEVALFALECSGCDSGGTACRSGKLCRVSDWKLIGSFATARKTPPMACGVARQVSDGCAESERSDCTVKGCTATKHRRRWLRVKRFLTKRRLSSRTWFSLRTSRSRRVPG